MCSGQEETEEERAQRRREHARKRIARTEAATVKVNKGFEHWEPKVFHR